MRNKKSTVIFVIILSLAVIFGIFVGVLRFRSKLRERMFIDNLHYRNSQITCGNTVMKESVN